MTAQIPMPPLPVKNKPPLRPLKWGAGLLLGAVAAWLLWQWANDMSGVRREAPKVPTIIPLPPPPPPPPEKPKEPEPQVEEKVPEPVPTPEPEEVKPAEEAPPSPADDLANPMQIDTVEYCYLEGNEGVYIESRNGFEVDGLEIKARLDFAAKAIDHRALYKNVGA